MSLLLGMLGGLAYGLTAFGGAFVLLPLLVLGAGIGLHAGLPVALLALGICAAIAAADAVRARQCDVFLSACLLLGGLPLAVAGAWLVQALPVVLLAAVFVLAALASAAALLRVVETRVDSVTVSPAALLNAPPRSLVDAAAGHGHDFNAGVRVAAVGAAGGALAALCGAPGGGAGAAVLRHRLPGQPFQVAGTLAFALALLAVIAAGAQFLLAPAAPGYTAGLFVLGAVAGMGLARRVPAALAAPLGRPILPLIVVALAVGLGVAVVAGWREPA